MDIDPAVMTAFGAVIAAITGLIVAVTALWRTVKDTHDLVNSQYDQQVARLEQLTVALTSRGMPVPDDPAIADAIRRAAQERKP